MARYRVRYVSHAAELRQLPRSLHVAFDAKVDDLDRNPYWMNCKPLPHSFA